MKGQLTIQYLASFIFFIGLIIYIYFAYSANLPAFVEEVRKEDVRSKAFQLSEILVNDEGNPVNWMEPSKVPMDVILVIDISSSMDGDTSPWYWGENCRIDCSTFGTGQCNCASGCPNRCADCDGDGHMADLGESPCAINDAKDASKVFVDELNDTLGQDRSGIVVFNQTDYLYQSLTSNKDTVKAKINTINTNPGANTAIGSGIRNATEELTNNGRPNANWIQVLLTDGRDYPSDSHPEDAAQEANETNITIYTIGLGPLDYFNETLLQNVASITGGKYYHAPSPTDLVDIYGQIAYELKFHVDRIGLSDENLNKTNLITMTKLRLLEDLCSNFENVQQRLAIEEPFSIHVFNISQDSGERNQLILPCISPDFSKTTINTTIKRIVALKNTETGELELAEIIVQM